MIGYAGIPATGNKWHKDNTGDNTPSSHGLRRRGSAGADLGLMVRGAHKTAKVLCTLGYDVILRTHNDAHAHLLPRPHCRRSAHERSELCPALACTPTYVRSPSLYLSSAWLHRLTNPTENQSGVATLSVWLRQTNREPSLRSENGLMGVVVTLRYCIVYERSILSRRYFAEPSNLVSVPPRRKASFSIGGCLSTLSPPP